MSDDRKHPIEPSDIDARLRAARLKHGLDDPPSAGAGPRNPSGPGLAARIGIEIVTTALVGAAVGWFVDDWLGTAPLFLIVILIFAAAAGVVNVYRVVKGLDDGVGLGRAIERRRRGAAGAPPNRKG